MIYIITLLLTLILVIIYDFLGYRKNHVFFYNLLMFILILIAGLRWHVGGDSFVYQDIFNNPNKIAEMAIEPGFSFFIFTSKKILNEFWFFQLLHAIFVNVILFKFFNKYTPFKFTAVLIYLYFYYFYFNMEILREVLSICIFCYWGYPQLVKKDYFKYYIFTIIAILFHTSAIILVIIPLLSKIKFNKKGIIYLSLLFTLVLSLLIFFPNILNFSDVAFNKFSTYSRHSFSFNGMVYNFIIFGLFPFFYIKFNEKYLSHNIFSNLIIPYYFIIFLYLYFSGLGRFINYFGPFMVVFLANSFFIIVKFKKFKNMRLIMLFFFFIGPFMYKNTYYFKSTSKYYLDTYKINIWYPYSSIFSKEEYEFRRIIFEEGMREDANQN